MGSLMSWARGIKLDNSAQIGHDEGSAELLPAGRQHYLCTPLNHSPAFKREVLAASPLPFPGSRSTLPFRYSIPDLSIGWPTFRRRRALTRISRGLTKGGQRLPSTCALVLDGVLSGRLHEGFPTSPGRFGLTRLQHGGFWVEKRARYAL